MVRAMLKAEAVVYEYPGKRALDGVSFVLPEGSVTALVGPNGAGKTTLLRCLAALDTPMGGNLWVDGIDVQNEPRACHHRLGFLPDNFGVWPELTVAQSLEYVARANGVALAHIKSRVRDTAQQLNLDDRLQEKAGSLSRGLRQRLAIGQAIIHQPKALLLDEPASGLDPEARHALAGLFLKLQSQGMTLLVSSHILSELEEYSSHMLILRDGRVVDQLELHAASSAAHSEHLLLELSQVFVLEPVLQRCEGVSQVHIASDGLRAELRLSGGAQARTHLLQQLIQSGVPVAGLQVKPVGLQDTYLERVSRHQQDAS